MSTETPQHGQPDHSPPSGNAERSTGRWVVVAMFLFAAVVIGSMWIYLDRHTAPFRPLRRALATEFEHSSPKVEGGQTRMSKNTPVILRIIMRVEFNPNKDPARAKNFAGRVLDFTRRHHDMSKYEVFEMHLYYLDPEQKIEEGSLDVDLKSEPVTPP